MQSWKGVLAAIFLLALCARVGFVLFLQSGYYYWDSVEYERAATSLLATGELGPKYHRSAVYPVFLAGVYSVFGNSILAVRLVESLLGAFTATLLALLGRRVADSSTGIAAGLIWACYPLAIFIAGLVYPETLTTLLLVAGGLLLARGRSEHAGASMVGAGVTLALVALLKPVAVLTIIGLLVWIIVFGRAGTRRPAGQFLMGAVAVVLLAGSVSTLAWGKFKLSDSRAIQFLDRAGTRNMQEVEMGAIRRAWRDPVRYMSRVASEFGEFWQVSPSRVQMGDQNGRDTFSRKDKRVVRRTILGVNSLTRLVSILSIGPVFLLAVVGTALLIIRRRWEDLTFFAVIILSFAIGYSFVFNQMRYRIPVEPYIVLLAGFGLLELGRLLQRRTRSVYETSAAEDR